jgi:hypothetical protein
MPVGQFDLAPKYGCTAVDLKALAEEVRHGNIEHSHPYR